MRLLWDGRALCSQSEWSIMGWHNSQRVCPGGYYGMALYLLPPCEILWDAAGRGRGTLLWDAGAARGGEGAAAPAAVPGGPQRTPCSLLPPSRPTAGPLAPSPAPQQFTAHSAGGVLWDGCSPRAGVRAWGGGCHGAFPVGGYYGMDSPLWTIMGCVRCRRVGLPRRAAGGALHCPARREPGRERGQPLGAALGHPAFRSALCLFQLGEVRRSRQPFRMIERRAK